MHKDLTRGTVGRRRPSPHRDRSWRHSGFATHREFPDHVPIRSAQIVDDRARFAATGPFRYDDQIPRVGDGAGKDLVTEVLVPL